MENQLWIEDYLLVATQMHEVKIGISVVCMHGIRNSHTEYS